MKINKKKVSHLNLIVIFLLTLALFSYVAINKFQKHKEKMLAQESILINLLTSVHPDLPWSFQSVEPKIVVKPGEVTKVEYVVENLGNSETTGVATFAYFPNQFGNYISKINCFCYDAQTLKPNQKSKYILVLLVDPQATKDNKTKNIKEVTIQFTFFDYKQYKKKES